ncbi:MAG: bifunctional diaminohydroxyphosphoribosylaminopyrimidine deaminase/5-amino-6-(5-phosphoribosylamino)uracil reductase RibD [Candidatus Omnitrophica bacterium]|nr:bifunctional diaminohydroxyphosphoribosylaminopyrimidine deaminase/5-amino-6-(5-phosphoribosylamino)uracil reductase RibD [Candidatus Omnitrophota bacterium]MDD5671994.1 bifunctional diaminohydroxyphosphoribosylaminopyrimidine deaminase/5-amino-6-(5-phosphoribosylamino)uracil reductase RibD [Candidatus Omnitrophota bacterium]
MTRSSDLKWMRDAIDLAKRGRMATSPNPMVGACVVRNGILVGKGYHEIYGGNHAEVNALKSAGKKAQGATLYVTLEPCSTWGKTPPCVAAIVQAGIREVVVGMLDPNPKNFGKGVAALKKAGIKVHTGVSAREVQILNEAFIKYVTKKFPFVTLKMAQTMDGKIATVTGRSRWISSKASRDFVHRLRTEQDALLVGRNTLLIDDPRLSPRAPCGKRNPAKPWRIILDPMLEASDRSRIFRGEQVTLCAVSEKILKDVRNRKRIGKRIFIPVRAKGEILDLKHLLSQLAGLGVAKLLVEGGGEVAWSFLKGGFVDKVYWILAPKIIGGRLAKTSVEGEGVRDLAKAFVFRETQMTKLGEDWLFEGRF